MVKHTSSGYWLDRLTGNQFDTLVMLLVIKTRHDFQWRLPGTSRLRRFPAIHVFFVASSRASVAHTFSPRFFFFLILSSLYLVAE